MADEGMTISCEHNIEYHIVTLFEKLETLRRDGNDGRFTGPGSNPPKSPMQVEIRTLEFWRSIISECLATFLYVFVVCGAVAGTYDSSCTVTSTISAALATGFAMATMVQCFGHVSGAHVNPAVTLAMAVTRHVSPLRAAMYITAQCGGGIAGAALLYGVTSWNGGGITQVATIAAWQRFGLEFILTFMVVFTFFVSTDGHKKWLGSASLSIGFSYAACSLVMLPCLNPARALGPSFVWDKWTNHWVQWLGPLSGGVMAGLIYEFIFNPRKQMERKRGRGRCDDSLDGGDSSSVQSDEDTYDHDQDGKHGRSTARIDGSPSNIITGGGGSSLYSAAPPAARLERVESLYGGTRSLYCKSPPLTRANLHRSQSVYAKSANGAGAVLRDREFTGAGAPRPGPLVPAVSLYPMRLQQHVQNQNAQNQARSGGGNGPSPPQRQQMCQQNQQQPPAPPQRPESVYGRARSAHSDDSSYGSTYRGKPGPNMPPTYHHSPSYHHSNSSQY